MRELAELVIELTGVASETRIRAAALATIPSSASPILRSAKDALGWQPAVALKEGLQHTIAYFDRLLSGHSNERIVPLRASARRRDS